MTMRGRCDRYPTPMPPYDPYANPGRRPWDFCVYVFGTPFLFARDMHIFTNP